LYPQLQIVDNSIPEVLTDNCYLVAASGSGKTAALYRHLCRNYGIFMVNTDPGESENEASDYSSACFIQELELAFVRGELEGLLHSTVHCLFLARLLWLEYVASSLGPDCQPRYLLLAQINGLTTHPLKIFEQLIQKNLNRAPRAEVLRLIKEAIQTLCAKLGNENFFVCIDEAQVYVNLHRLSNTHIYSVNGTRRPGNILSIQAECLTEIKTQVGGRLNFIFSGTQYGDDIHGVLRSAAGVTISLHQLSPELMTTSSDVLQFFETHINLNEETKQDIKSNTFSKTYLPARRRVMANALMEFFKCPEYGLKSAIDAATNHFETTIATRLAREVSFGWVAPL